VGLRGNHTEVTKGKRGQSGKGACSNMKYFSTEHKCSFFIGFVISNNHQHNHEAAEVVNL
jgi:hypothetical protein